MREIWNCFGFKLRSQWISEEHHSKSKVSTFKFTRIQNLEENVLQKLAYLKDSNAVAHSVDSGIFYIAIYLSARSKSYITTFIS